VGRQAIFELLTIDDTIRSLILKKPDNPKLKAAGKAQGMKFLRDDGFDKALQGITTPEEILRVTQEE
jgi:type II secretory ATPase GspE/PulE/Tfp pilus assembly ATPase PilB-like protein